MLQKKEKYVVAVVGATGTIGREMVSILEERNFPTADMLLFASERSEGERVEYRGKNLPVKKLTGDSFSGVDLALFSAGDERSIKFAPVAVRAGCVVIDNSGAFCMAPRVPLVIPEVNPDDLSKHSGIISSPGCSTIGLLMVLKPLHDAAAVKRVVVTTFQSVSGTGKEAMDELASQTVALLNFKDIETKVYPHQIAFNCLPHIDAFLQNGSTKEEQRMSDEAKKVLGDAAIRVTATCVRVPVFRGHGESVNIETEKKLSANDARAVIAGMSGVTVYDDPSRDLYPFQLEVAGKDEVYVGRIREDETIPNGLSFWVVSDNIRKGSALNAVQIAELLIR